MVVGLIDAIRDAADPQFCLGVSFMLVGTLTQNIGLGFMKLSHLREVAKPVSEQIPYWRCRTWWIALVLFLSGAILDFASLGLLPASLALPLGGIGLVASAVFASRYLGEVFTFRDKIGTGLIIAGSWSAIIFARKVDEEISAENLLARLDITKPSGLYVVCVVLWQVTMFFVQKYRVQNAVIASVIPGSIGAFGNIGGKGSAELLKKTFMGENQFHHPFTYFFIAFTASMLIFQNHWLQHALKYYDQVIVVPIYYVSICMFSVLGGVLFFGEWENTTVVQDLLFTCGVTIIFIGVWFLTHDHLKPEYFLARDMDGAEPPPLMLSHMAFEEAEEEEEQKLISSHSRSSDFLGIQAENEDDLIEDLENVWIDGA